MSSAATLAGLQKMNTQGNVMKLYLSQKDGPSAGGAAFVLLQENGEPFPCIRAASIHHAADEVTQLDLCLVVDDVHIVFGTPAHMTESNQAWPDRLTYDLGNSVTFAVDYSPAETMMFLLATRNGDLVRVSKVNKHTEVEVWYETTKRWLKLCTAQLGAKEIRPFQPDTDGDVLLPLMTRWHLGALLTDTQFVIIEN